LPDFHGLEFTVGTGQDCWLSVEFHRAPTSWQGAGSATTNAELVNLQRNRLQVVGWIAQTRRPVDHVLHSRSIVPLRTEARLYF